MNKYINAQNLIDDTLKSMENNPHEDPKLRRNHQLEHNHFLNLIYRQTSLKSFWVWYEDWTPSTTDAPAECLDAGWYCNNCGWSPNQELGIEFDIQEDIPKFNFCPNCGLPMNNQSEVFINEPFFTEE